MDLHRPTWTTAKEAWSWWFAGLGNATSGLPMDLDARLERARVFIDAHHADPIDLDLIARCAFMSRYHFLRRFRRAYGATPHQYLTRARLKHARRLLLETELSVAQICFEVGFQSQGSFTSLFARHMGHPPGRYRARRFAVLASPAAQPPPIAAVPWCFYSMHQQRSAT